MTKMLGLATSSTVESYFKLPVSGFDGGALILRVPSAQCPVSTLHW